MKKNLILSGTIICFGLAASAQNVGIGTITPTEAKLQVESIGNSTLGMFSNGTVGISLITENNHPGVGMNILYAGGSYKFKGAGFAGLFFYRPENGSMTYYSSSASGAVGGAVSFSSIMHLQADGNIGIGTTSPSEAKLQIHEPAGNTQLIAAAGSNLPGISTFVPVSSPSIGFNTRYQSGYKFMGTGYAGFFQFSPSSGLLSFYNSSTKGSADGSISSVYAMGIDSNGYVGIKTSTPKAQFHVNGSVVFGASSISPATGYRLSVDGKIMCEELRVQLSTSWPDYVFSDNYELPSIHQLEKYIQLNKHLPGIPAASNLEKEGLAVGDMQKRMMEKIEELTLYIIHQQKEIDALKARIK